MAPEIRPKSFGTFEKQAPSVFFFFFFSDEGGGEKFFYPNNFFFLVDVARNTFNGSLHGHYRRKQMRADYLGSRIVNNV